MMLRVIAGKYKGRQIKTSAKLEARPTMAKVREAIFSILLSRRSIEGSKVIDLFSGSGSFTFEALSRGAQHSFVVEANYDNLQFIKNTATEIGTINDLTLLCCHAEKLPRASTQCDLVFIDPPYNSGLVESTLRSLAQNNWLANGADVLIEIKKNESFEIIPGFESRFERVYGITKIVFLSYTGCNPIPPSGQAEQV